MAYPLVLFANVGTSIIGNFRHGYEDGAPEVREMNAQIKALETSESAPSELEATGHLALGTPLIDKLTAVARASPMRASAEVNSIFKLADEHARSGEEPTIAAIYLLATDTVKGMLTAHVVKKLLAERFGDTRIEIDRIGGLQVRNGADFLRYGLPDYIQKIYEHLRQTPAESFKRVFIPTGGFKALVPYMTLIAMLEGAETRYIFEQSDALLTLQPLPIAFDEALVKDALPAMAATDEQGSLTLQELEEQLKLDVPFRATPFASIWTMCDEDAWMLSGLGEILWQRARSHEDRVLLSAAARQDLKKMSLDKRNDVLKGLEKLRFQGYRASGLHGVYRPEKTDCQCLGRNQMRYRIHFWEDDTDELRVYVARIFHISQHDTRDGILDGTGIFKKDFNDWELFA